MRILVLLFPCFWCIGVRSQLRLGVQGGYSRVTWAPINPTSSDYFLFDSYKTSGLSGFQTGVVAEVKLSDRMFLRPALFVSGKGTTLNQQRSSDTSSRAIWIQYIEAPITLVYQRSLGRKVAGFAGGGFYAAQAFRGVEKGEGKSLGGEFLIYNEVEFGTHNDGPAFQLLPTIVKPFDYGLTVLAGVELKSVQLLVTYSHGLTTLLPNGEPYNGNYTNSGLTVSATYLIKTKRKGKEDEYFHIQSKAVEHCMQRPGLLPWRTSNLVNVPGRSGVNLFQKRRVAPQSHGSKPMLPAVLLSKVVDFIMDA